MSTSHPSLELAQRLFAAFEEGSVDAVIDLISDDFVLVVPPSMSAEPDTYDGPDGVRRYMDGFEGAVDDVRFIAGKLYPEEDFVLAEMRMSGRGATSGLPVDMDAAVVIRMSGGKITGIEPHPDLVSARRALRGR